MTKKILLVAIALMLVSASICFANRGDLNWVNSNPTAFSMYDAEQGVLDAKGAGAPDYVFGIIGHAKYAVKAYQIKYWSVNYANTPTLVSGMILVPQVPAKQSSPVLVYQHATIMSNDGMPSMVSWEGKLSAETKGQAATMAARGYVVVMSDFVGEGLCTTEPNEYLFAQGEANNGVDAYIAAQSFFAQKNVKTNGKLFLAGYSQGGQAVAALAQLLQKSYPQYPVTAAAFMEGPYDASLELEHLLQPGGVSLEMDGINVNVGSLISAEAVASLNRIYNWGPLNTIFVAPYAERVQNDFTKAMTSLETKLLDFNEKNTLAMLTPAFTKLVQSSMSQVSKNIAHNSTYQWAPKMPVVFLTSKVDTLIPDYITGIAYQYMKGAGGNVTLEFTGLPLNHLQNGMPATACAYRFFGTHGGIN